MSESHRKNIEQFLGNQRNQFQEEYDEDQDDLGGIELDDQFKKDAQYQELIGDLQGGQPISSKKRAGRPLEDLPKYKGKKVTRQEIEEIDEQDLMISDSDLEDDDDDDDDDDEEDGDNDDNSNEDNSSEDDLIDDEDSEESEPVQTKKANNINKRKQSKDSNIDEDEDIENNDDEEFKQLKKITKKIVDSKKNKTYIQDKLQVDDIINEIDEEDHDLAPESKKQQDDEVQRAKGVRQQIQLWKELVFLRFNMNKNLELIKKYPSPEDLSGFLTNEKTVQNVKYLELNILRNIDLLQKTRGNLTERANGPKDRILKKSQLKSLQKFIHHNNVAKSKYENDYALNVQNLWHQYEESFDGMHSWMEENILKWSQKTQLLNSINLKRSGLGALVHTPIGQTQKAMQQLDNLVYKSQLKRSTFRILGKDVSNVQRDTDSEIYDDSDVYHQLLKDYMTEIEENKEVGEDGLLFDSTRLYLLERKLKQQEKKQLLVDRRASKARKIRFDVHQKLVNFMNPVENKEILEGRNEIIKCLFGKFAQEILAEEVNGNNKKNEQNGSNTQANANEEPSLNKKRKSSSKNKQSLEKDEEDDGVQLI